jgi:hypothetical protein
VLAVVAVGCDRSAPQMLHDLLSEQTTARGFTGLARGGV